MFIDPSQFSFVRTIEHHWQDIRDEFLALSEDCFDPWVQQQMHGKGWSVYGLFTSGNRVEGGCI